MWLGLKMPGCGMRVKPLKSVRMIGQQKRNKPACFLCNALRALLVSTPDVIQHCMYHKMLLYRLLSQVLCCTVELLPQVLYGRPLTTGVVLYC